MTVTNDCVVQQRRNAENLARSQTGRVKDLFLTFRPVSDDPQSAALVHPDSSRPLRMLEVKGKEAAVDLHPLSKVMAKFGTLETGSAKDPCLLPPRPRPVLHVAKTRADALRNPLNEGVRPHGAKVNLRKAQDPPGVNSRKDQLLRNVSLRQRTWTANGAKR